MKDFKSIVKNETENFFQDLINQTGCYYLSDYVLTYGEFDSEIISIEDHKKIVSQRLFLGELCKEYNLDIHQISCEVARKNFDF